MNTLTKKYAIGLAFACGMLMSSGLTNAATYNFYNITNDSPDIADQLSMEVLNYSGTQVSFTFYNDVGIASTIQDIYFDDGLPAIVAGPITILASAGVLFDTTVAPPDLPGGDNLNPDFIVTAGLSADASSPNPTANGVNSSSEWVTLILNYTGGSTIATILAALNTGSLRVGLHVQGITGGTSDSYVNIPGPNQTVVPLPAGILLLISALGGLGFLARFRNAGAAA